MALTACASKYHIGYAYPDACSRIWTRDTVLDGHGDVCVTTYRQVSPTFSSTYRALTLPSDWDPLLSQLHRRGITCRLTYSTALHRLRLQEISQDLSVY